MALVPTDPAQRPAPRGARPPPRVPARQRSRIRSALADALADLEADAVLLAGSVTDTAAAIAAGLWTPAHAARPRARTPSPRRVADELGLTLHTVPAWHLDEGRTIAADELDVQDPRRRERAARLAAAAAAARRQGADTVLAGAGAAGAHEGCLPLASARTCIERYGLELRTPFADPRLRDELAEAGPASRRWRGRSWPAWPLREALADRLPAALAWPMQGLATAGRRG